jgi:hypothetical protein
MRTRIALLAAEGIPNTGIAAQLDCWQPAMRPWG